jgi:uncharacterized protein (DUF302 family)
MATRQIIVERFSATSSKPFQDVVSRLEAALGHPDMSMFRKEVTSAKTYPEVEKIVGNPLIMSQMVEHVPEAGSYAPVTILIDERQDGVHLSYDTMASVLTPYGSPEAMKVAQELDSKVEALLTAAMS